MKERRIWTDDEARLALLVARQPCTVHELVRASGLSLRAVLVALNRMLTCHEVTARPGARYALNEDIAWRLRSN